MSSIARWSYASEATIKPRIGADEWGQVTYGPEYSIKCSFHSEASQARDDAGNEFVIKTVFYTEDTRPKYLDLIKRPGADEFEEIRAVTCWDMSFFNDTPDYKLITG